MHLPVSQAQPKDQCSLNLALDALLMLHVTKNQIYETRLGRKEGRKEGKNDKS